MKPGVGAAAQATSRDEPLSRSSVLRPAPALSVRPAPPGPEAHDDWHEISQESVWAAGAASKLDLPLPVA